MLILRMCIIPTDPIAMWVWPVHPERSKGFHHFRVELHKSHSGPISQKLYMISVRKHEDLHRQD